MNFTEELSLQRIREELNRLEDSIIFALIERSQFKHNNKIYSNEIISPSFLVYFLHEIEKVHSTVRRYTSPDEVAFTDNLPHPILPLISYPNVLYPNNINMNSELLCQYINEIVPLITRQGDDGNYGSSATKDVECLQLLSRRIHFGRLVAEAKFNSLNHSKYVECIKNKDESSLLALLTDQKVEDGILDRLKRKALIYGSGDGEADETRMKLAEVVVGIYANFVIPVTKRVQIKYLMQRC